VLTTLQAVGLGKEVAARDLGAIRAWFDAQDPSAYVSKVLSLAGLKYVVMTNIPFDQVGSLSWYATAAPSSTGC